MWSYRKSRGTGNDPESLLRSQRPEARDEFVDSLAQRVNAQPARRPMAWSRLAFAGAASSLILGMFATVGGFAYVASGATATYAVAKQAVVKHRVSLAVPKSSASEEYPTNTPPEQNNTTPPKQNVAGTQTQGSVAAVAGANTLPFTGISLLTTVLVGLSLLTLGFVLRRRERRDS
jgi:hypothetical protein